MYAVQNYVRLADEYKRSVADTYAGGETRNDHVTHCVDGAIKLIDALSLLALIQDVKPQRILEVGSYLGFSTRWLLEITNTSGAKVTSLDPRVRHRIFDDLKGHLVKFTNAFADRLELVDGFLCERNIKKLLFTYLNYEPQWEPRAALDFLESIPIINSPVGVFDFAFVDGEHTFNATYSNVALVADMMPYGGIIAVHDAISWPEVVPALQRLTAEKNHLQFKGILGADFWVWGNQNHVLAQKDFNIGALVDGIAVMQVLSR